MREGVGDTIHIDYDGEYGSERVLIVSGRATVVPDDRSPCPAAFHVAISTRVVGLSSRARCSHATRVRLTVSMWIMAQGAE